MPKTTTAICIMFSMDEKFFISEFVFSRKHLKTKEKLFE